MIRDLSLTLRAVLTDPALATDFPELAAAQVLFDRPVEAFNPPLTTLDLFLFDIRENRELRSNERYTTVTNGQFTIRQAPLRIDCSYLVTAWPTGGTELFLQEHQLLGQALQVFSRYPRIPATFLKGQLAGQTPPLPMMTAQADGVREPYEFWSAIGNKMRASIIVTATIGIEAFPPITAHEVTVSEVNLGTPRFRIGGRVTSAGPVPVAGAPIAGATARLVEIDLAAQTDEAGRYQLGAMAAGTYTLRVQKDASVKTVTVIVPPGPGTNFDVQL
jgi:hypothetical protein